MFDRAVPSLLPDDTAFVDSLTPEQAVYMFMALKDVRHQKVVPLREALMHRCLDLDDKIGARQRMFAQFFKPPEPIRAVKPNGPRPRRK